MSVMGKGDPKEGWERGDFPILCETCLGPNPYVRMMKAEYDKECKICSRPFTVFRWKPGTDARYKKTEICQTCAKVKNVCQTCLLDLEFGLPVQVRDAAMNGPGNVPQSDTMREWTAMQNERNMKEGLLEYQTTAGRQEMRNNLIKLARSSPYYKRNEAHVCSFFLKGNCRRGESCPYRHDNSKATDKNEETNELTNQNMKDRYFGVNDPVAKKLLNKVGEDKAMITPSDVDIKTLFITNVDNSITEQDIRDNFYSFGEITDIKLVLKNNCCFVTYATRDQAQLAINKLHNNVVINGKSLRVYWSKKENSDNKSNNYNNNYNNNNNNNYYNNVPTPYTYNYNFVPPPNPNNTQQPYYASMNPNQFGSYAKRDR